MQSQAASPVHVLGHMHTPQARHLCANHRLHDQRGTLRVLLHVSFSKRVTRMGKWIGERYSKKTTKKVYLFIITIFITFTFIL